LNSFSFYNQPGNKITLVIKPGGKELEDKKKKKTSAKTLQTAREASYFGKKLLTSARRAAEEGRPVAWSMFDYWFGCFIARAMGVEIVYPENYGALCAALRRAEPFLDYAESDGVPGTTCGYARNCIGYARKLKENNYVIPEGAPGGAGRGASVAGHGARGGGEGGHPARSGESGGEQGSGIEDPGHPPNPSVQEDEETPPSSDFKIRG